MRVPVPVVWPDHTERPAMEGGFGGGILLLEQLLLPGRLVLIMAKGLFIARDAVGAGRRAVALGMGRVSRSSEDGSFDTVVIKLAGAAPFACADGIQYTISRSSSVFAAASRDSVGEEGERRGERSWP